MGIIKNLAIAVDKVIFKPIIALAYPNFENLYPEQLYYFQLFKRYFIMQKLFRINGSIPWPVDFRSQVVDWDRIEKDRTSYPGGSMGCYIGATGGLKIGSHVIIGPNTIISTTNHSGTDYTSYGKTKGVIIGNNVWIGANCSIVAGTEIGDNVIIGAGCYVKGLIPANSLVKQSDTNLLISPRTPKV